MAPLPLLAEFAVRLSTGVGAFLILTPWAKVPPKFFQTHCQVILALLVLAALDVSREPNSGPTLALIVSAALFAYLGSIAWGVGYPQIGTGLGLAITLCLILLVSMPLAHSDGVLPWVMLTGRLSSAMVMGSTLTAMLLGHYYLAAPAMSIFPLRGLVRWMAGSLAVRILLSGLGMMMWIRSDASAGTVEPIFVAMRWGMGLAGPVLATTLAWKTVEIRSTQSATGILYIAMTLVLFGEVSALVLARSVAWLV